MEHRLVMKIDEKVWKKMKKEKLRPIDALMVGIGALSTEKDGIHEDTLWKPDNSVSSGLNGNILFGYKNRNGRKIEINMSIEEALDHARTLITAIERIKHEDN